MSQSIPSNASTAALLAARQLHQQLQAQAKTAWETDRWWHRGIITLAVCTALLTVIPCMAEQSSYAGLIIQSCRVGLVAAGLALLVLVGLSQRRQDNQTWLTLAAGAAAIDRARYLYRTVLQGRSDRSVWLNQQLARTQQQLQEQLGSRWRSPLPIVQTSETDRAETQDLLADAYVNQRLLPHLTHVAAQVMQLSTTRQRYQMTILACLGLGVILPLLSASSTGWSAIAPLFALAVLLWLRISSLERWLQTQGELLLGITLLRDSWQSLPADAHTGETFFRLVMAAETLIVSPYRQVVDQVRDSIDLLQQPEPDLLRSVLSQPVPEVIEQGLRGLWHSGAIVATPDLLELAVSNSDSGPDTATVLEATEVHRVEAAPSESNGKTAAIAVQVEVMEPTESTVDTAATNATATTTVIASAIAPAVAQPQAPPPAPQRGRPHAFVVMPFGRKQGPDGRWIDFNRIYQGLIKPALEEAGFEPFRADEEASSGDILTDMFQELLLADLVVADLSIDNANVFYELGIRHALRRRGVVHIQAGRSYMPFDIFNVRTLPYHCDSDGCPDVAFLEKDQQALTKMIRATWASERNRVHSPIFTLLTGLLEPDRKSLRTPLAVGYWQEYTTLQSRITIAQRQKRIGDVVLLAEEVSNPLVKEDIIAEAGKALKSMNNSALALKQYRQGLKINPENVTFRCEEAYHLSRLGQSDEAIVKLEQLLQDLPHCVDATTYLARIYKELWKQNWIGISDEAQRIRIAYEASFLLQKSIENYLRGYRLDQNQYYPGVNALTLTALLDYLAQTVEIDSGDADEASYRSQLTALKGSVRFCLESNLHKSPNDYWAALSLGDLAVCTAESPQHVATAYRKALAILWNNKFALQATLDQLKLMKLLNFRPEHVQAGIYVLQTELDRFEQQERLFAPGEAEEEMAKPAQVFLFTGHMIDNPNRAKPRFPAAMEVEVIQRLEATFEKLGAHANCIAIVPGLACGGDILFVEACLKRNMKVEIYLPFESSDFIQDSVNFAGDSWVERFYTILNHPNVTLHLQPERLGAVPEGDDAYGRNNRWALYSTLMHDVSRVRLIALWNGQGGDGPGGTADMVQQVRQLGGIVEHLDITKFDYWRSQGSAMELLHHSP